MINLIIKKMENIKNEINTVAPFMKSIKWSLVFQPPKSAVSFTKHAR
jgi:hypothetical protein